MTTRCTYHPNPDDHRLHFVGDPCCVANGCEPGTVERKPDRRRHRSRKVIGADMCADKAGHWTCTLDRDHVGPHVAGAINTPLAAAWYDAANVLTEIGRCDYSAISAVPS